MCPPRLYRRVCVGAPDVFPTARHGLHGGPNKFSNGSVSAITVTATILSAGAAPDAGRVYVRNTYGAPGSPEFPAEPLGSALAAGRGGYHA